MSSSNGLLMNKSQNELPFVGIAMATYNPCLSYLIDQITSLKNQTYKNWKCVVVDDNSNDEKFSNILQIIGDDPRFEIHRNSSNLGSFKTFERALGLVPKEADFICFCDQDDIWISTKIELQLMAFEDPIISLVHTDQSLIDEKNRVFVASCWTLEGRDVLEATTDLLLFRNLITGCTTMFRRSVLQTALPFCSLRPIKEMYHHDMWISMHACVHGRVVGLKQPLVLYRQHGGNLVGVSRLRRNTKWSELSKRAGYAYSERRWLREDFLGALESLDLEQAKIQQGDLAYLDNPFKLVIKGFRFVLEHPLFFRTWVMLGVGLVSFHLRKRYEVSAEKTT